LPGLLLITQVALTWFISAFAPALAGIALAPMMVPDFREIFARKSPALEAAPTLPL
jgi:hypothetical protein